MISVMESVIITSGTAILTGLVTYFITSISTKKDRIDEIAVHEKIHHMASMQEVIKNHLDSCNAPHKTEKMLIAMIWIVTKLDGDPKDLGLIE